MSIESVVRLWPHNNCEILIKGYEVINDQLCVVGLRQSWHCFARWCSTFLGGQWWPRVDGCTWLQGSRRVWFTERSVLPSIVDAVDSVRSFGLDCGWSIGSAARALLKYVGKGYPASRHHHPFAIGAGRNYVDCRPGVYPRMAMHDAKAYYYTLLRGLPSWQPIVGSSGRIIFCKAGGDETSRRDEVLEFVKDRKPLRNSLVGCMTGRGDGASYFCRGELCELRGQLGPFRSAGLLVVRLGWELTRQAAREVDSVLSLVDCVTEPHGEVPPVWDRCGIQTGVKAFGVAEICNPVVFRVGEHDTALFRRGSRFKESHPCPDAPPIHWAARYFGEKRFFGRVC